MPYTKFICLDGEKVDIQDCLKNCRLKNVVNPKTGCLYVTGGRCLSRRALEMVADQREWTGKPSTTQLLRGTRESYLIITKDFAISPRDSLFMLHGTKSHGVLEKYTPEGTLSEVRLDDGISTGAFDFFDETECEEPDTGYLYDVKTYGSYKVAHTIGLEDKKIPTGQFFKNGNPKFYKVFTPTGRHDRFDLAVQLNDYRMKIKKCLGKETKQMLCEIIVRDGNTYMATSRGVTEPGYLVPINRITDKWVQAYMTKKAKNLSIALETNVMPPPCRPRERWGGRKCSGYCQVSEFCELGKEADVDVHD